MLCAGGVCMVYVWFDVGMFGVVCNACMAVSVCMYVMYVVYTRL